jgi:succinate dehydrogenase / fumarate reductase, flavoprotein subunit
VIIASGGLTRIYRRNSASANMGGDGYALALAAGADLVDMEFVQFFPIGHLAPRLVGMDPIMWDPFRYKLGGRLLDGQGREFLAGYGSDESAGYTTPRDIATYAIEKEVAAGRGSPHGGVYLSFAHLPRAELEAAFGPVIERLAKNGIDLGRVPVEVAPIAHYHMGGIAADEKMQTGVPGLYAAGEAVGGANGANRLSGNAITEALVFGREAGGSAAAHARGAGLTGKADNLAETTGLIQSGTPASNLNTAELLQHLQSVMQDNVGPLRNAAKLQFALDEIAHLQDAIGETPPGEPGRFDMRRLDWFDLRNMLLVARVVTEAALARQETRGAQQREDFPQTSSTWKANQAVTLRGGALTIARQPVRATQAEPA